MNAIWIVALFMLNTLLMPLVVELIKERSPGLARRVIAWAVRLLPRVHRDRYRDEWIAELEEMERQNVSQLVSSLRILFGAPSMGWVLRLGDRRRLIAENGRERLVERVGRLWRRWIPRTDRRYREFVLSGVHLVDVRGLTTMGFYTPALDEVFVEVSLASPGQHDALDRRVIRDFLGRPKPVTLAVLGSPGSGKSMMLRRTAQMICRDPKRSRRAVPILLHLRDHVDMIVRQPDLSLATLVHLTMARDLGLPGNWFEKRLAKGDCVVLLDGMDEAVRREDLRMVADWIERQIEQYPKNDFVVTSRPQAYRSASISSATVLQTRSLDTVQVDRFVHNWYLADRTHMTDGGDEEKRALAKAEAQDLLDSLRSRSGLIDLTVNPLLLTMIANVHRYRAALPRSRGELYSEICQVMLWRRQEAKRLPSELSGDRKENLLWVLAFTMMQERRCDLSRADVLARLGTALRRMSCRVSPDELLADVSASGLLIEREHGVFGFVHFGLQEYLAAAHVRATGAIDVLVAAVDDPWWRETTLLYTGLTDTGSEQVIRACLDSRSPAALSLAKACLDHGPEFLELSEAELEVLRSHKDETGQEP